MGVSFWRANSDHWPSEDIQTHFQTFLGPLKHSWSSETCRSGHHRVSSNMVFQFMRRKNQPKMDGKKKKRTEKLGVNLNSTQGSLALNYVNGKWLPHSDLWFFSVSLHWSHSNVSCCHLMTISASVLRLYQVPSQQGRGMLPSWGHGQVLRSILLLRFWDLTL